MSQQRDLSDYVLDLSSTLLDAAQTIEQNHSRCAIVVTGEKVVGIITEGDLLRGLLQGSTIYADIKNFVRHDFKFLKNRDEAEALDLFKTHGFTLVPVLDEDFRLIDVIPISDILEKVRLA
ncbi:MAG TPA: CBS domain-containing protein [Rhodospirillales bacterium]|nr:CBS domain-containing protein [Rhodospirillales bacterium]